MNSSVKNVNDLYYLLPLILLTTPVWLTFFWGTQKLMIENYPDIMIGLIFYFFGGDIPLILKQNKLAYLLQSHQTGRGLWLDDAYELE